MAKKKKAKKAKKARKPRAKRAATLSPREQKRREDATVMTPSKMEKLIATAQADGINVNSLMNENEVRREIADFQMRKRQEAEDAEKMKAIQENAAAETEAAGVQIEQCKLVKKDKMVGGDRVGKSLVVEPPEDYRKIDRREILKERHRGNRIVVIFSTGPKISYNARTFMRVRD